MMAVVIRKKLALKQFVPKTKTRFYKYLRREFADEIVAFILTGSSPVTGKRFEKYSEGYAAKKGRFEPVDMLVTGEMLNSLRVTERTTGAISIFFKSKIAKYHNTLGAGASGVIRRLLPDRKGEVFANPLMRLLKKRLQNSVKETLR